MAILKIRGSIIFTLANIVCPSLGLWQRADWWVINEVSEKHSTSIFKVQVQPWICPSNMLVPIYQTKRRSNTKDRNINFACCLVLKHRVLLWEKSPVYKLSEEENKVVGGRSEEDWVNKRFGIIT
jgi:hypothetical protein